MNYDLPQLLARGQYREAFDLVADQLQEKVFRLAFSMLQSESLAEDVCQEIFVKVWKGLPAYKATATISSWVYTIARNTCLTELKKRRPHQHISLDDPQVEGLINSAPTLQIGAPEPGAEVNIAKLLNSLPEKYRQVLVLYYFEEKSYEQVAEMMNLPLGTVKTYIFRAKKQLSKHYKRCHNANV